MAQIERKHQKVFGGNLSPSGNISVYGSKLAGTVSYSDNLDVIQNSSWLLGLIGSVSPNKAPYLQDLNAIFYTITKQLAYVFQAGIPEWNSETEYFANKSFVIYNGTIYRAKANNTNIQPTVTTNWENYWETLDRFDKIMPFDSSHSSILNGYPLNAVLDYVADNGSIYKIRSLVDNNTNIPTPNNIRVSSSQTGVFYWELMNNGFMPGAIIPFAGSVIPNGWLLCNGQEVSKTNYDFLYKIIGNTYGEAVNTNNFKLPNFSGSRIPIGESTNFPIGSSGGEENHTLTIDEMPSHNHILNYGFQGAGGGGQGPNTPGQIRTGNTGGGQAHNNMQPYTVIKGYIIKF